MKKKDGDRFQGLDIKLAGIKIRTPIGIGSVGSLSVNPGRQTPELRAEVLLKDVEAGAGYICLPTTRYITDALLSDLEKKAKPFQFRGASTRPLIFMRADKERRTMYNIGPPVKSPGSLVGIFQRNTLGIIQILREKKPKDVAQVILDFITSL